MSNHPEPVNPDVQAFYDVSRRALQKGILMMPISMIMPFNVATYALGWVALLALLWLFVKDLREAWRLWKLIGDVKS